MLISRGTVNHLGEEDTLVQIGEDTVAQVDLWRQDGFVLGRHAGEIGAHLLLHLAAAVW